VQPDTSASFPVKRRSISSPSSGSSRRRLDPQKEKGQSF
jgi:hypothetical protein